MRSRFIELSASPASIFASIRDQLRQRALALYSEPNVDAFNKTAEKIVPWVRPAVWVAAIVVLVIAGNAGYAVSARQRSPGWEVLFIMAGAGNALFFGIPIALCVLVATALVAATLLFWYFRYPKSVEQLPAEASPPAVETTENSVEASEAHTAMAESRPFQFTGRLRSFRHAGAGIWRMIQCQHNAWIHAAVTIVVLTMGLAFQLSGQEWCWIILAISIVWTAEALNTAFEFLADAATPDFDPIVRAGKDVAAGAVLITAVAAAIIGAIIFWPHVAALLFH